DWFVSRRENVAGLRNQIAACGESDHPYPVGIEIQLLGPCPDQPDRPLRVLERAWNLRCDVAVTVVVPVVITIGDAILGHDASNSFGCQPTANFGPFQSDH